jgi:pantoate--beta-alanine ligase
MTSTASRLRGFTSISDLRTALAAARSKRKSVALVPTMGALHEGHLRLIDRAREAADIVVMSIFVNPLQFGAGEDFSKYPRDLAADTQLAADRGVDILFAPDRKEMYPEEPLITVHSGHIGEVWEGESRPGHFEGVLTVVAKLFNIVEPDTAVFGQKDLQQLAVVRAMVRDLAFPIEIIAEPTVRDEDGLALSSRNRYLSPEDRAAARTLPRALSTMLERFNTGTPAAAAIESAGRDVLDTAKNLTCDYLAVIDPVNFQSVETAVAGCAAIGAVRVGKTRLIDNIIFT